MKHASLMAVLAGALSLVASVGAVAHGQAPDAPSAELTFPGGYQLPPLEPSDRATVGGGAPLTLGAVLASVERHHPTLESARQSVRAAEGEQLAAEGGFDLSLTAQGWAAPVGYYDWGRADVMLEQPTPLWGASVSAGWRIGRGGDVPSYYGQYQTLDAGEVRARVRVPLWRDGPIDARRARMWRAEHATDAEEASLEARRLSMRLDAARAYWSWVAAGQRYQVAAGLLELAEAREAQVAARVGAGAIPAIESLENRRAVLSRRTSLVSARRALEGASIALSLYLRRDDGSPRVPRPSAVPLVTEDAPPLSVDVREEVNAAWGRRPEMERYRALLRRQRVSVDYAENQLAPRIDLTVGASVDLGSGTADQQSVLGPAVVEGSVLVSLPLQFREARGGIDRSNAELAALEADAQLVREQIGAAVQDAYSAVRAAEERQRLAAQSAEVASAVADAERRRFELGATQLFIVNLREQAAAAADAVLIDARAELQVAHARFAAATGAALSDAPR
ncbi:MAG: TolC family protein [Sandaracinaceae bacterium]|nr:TolC family protein [Sandaracinaceae bacterium]